MDSLVGYGSDDDETERFRGQQTSVGGGARRREDDTNYDDVNMDLSEDSHGAESEPELPPADPLSATRRGHDDRRASEGDRDRDRDRDRERERERRDRRRESPRRDRPDKRSPRRDDKYRSDRGERDRSRGSHDGSRRGLLGDRPEDRAADSKMPALMDLKPFGGDPPPGYKSQDARDAVSPRFVDRDRRDRERPERERERDRERDRERERDRDRHSRRSPDRRSSHRSGYGEHRARSRSRSSSSSKSHAPHASHAPNASHAPHAPHASHASHAHSNSAGDRRGSPPSGDYRPSSYKVNKKLEVMEKMGLQIKTPDGSMATAQQLRAAAGEAPHGSGAPSYYNAGSISSNRIMEQVQKRKLLWSNKGKSEAEEAAKWSGTRFAQDSDGKQVSKFMRLMGIKEPGALKTDTAPTVDPIKKQEELFQAMQAQYEVARATTHTMRGVGLGFQRPQY